MFSNLIARFVSSSSVSGIKTLDLPLQEGLVSNGRKDSNEFRPGQLSATQPRSKRIVIISTALAISLRVVLSGLILNNGQCAIASVEVRCLSYRIQRILTPVKGYLPLLLAIYDYWYIQRRRPKSDNSSRTNGRTLRNLLPVIFLTAAYAVKVSVMGAPRSTYICPLSSSANSGVPFMQILSILLDCYILLSISGVASTPKEDASPKSDDSSAVVGCIFLVIRDTVIRFERFFMLNSHRFLLWYCSSAVSSHSVSTKSTGWNYLAPTGRILVIWLGKQFSLH